MTQRPFIPLDGILYFLVENHWKLPRISECGSNSCRGKIGTKTHCEIKGIMIAKLLEACMTEGIFPVPLKWLLPNCFLALPITWLMESVVPSIIGPVVKHGHYKCVQFGELEPNREISGDDWYSHLSRCYYRQVFCRKRRFSLYGADGAPLE